MQFGTKIEPTAHEMATILCFNAMAILRFMYILNCYCFIVIKRMSPIEEEQ